MWDTAEATDVVHLSHAVLCTRCGHESHQFLACSDTCACVPPALPWLPAAHAALSRAPRAASTQPGPLPRTAQARAVR